MKNSRIEWTDHTFNPWIGCTEVSSGCDNCYARETFDGRRKMVRWGACQPRHRTSLQNWHQPYVWNQEAQRSGTHPRVFCASLADVFDSEVDDRQLALAAPAAGGAAKEYKFSLEDVGTSGLTVDSFVAGLKALYVKNQGLQQPDTVME